MENNQFYITQSRLLYVYKIDDIAHSGLIKVGEVFVPNDVADRNNADEMEREVRRQLDNRDYIVKGAPYVLLAVFPTTHGNKCYTAQNIHDVLQKKLGINRICLRKSKKSVENDIDIWFEGNLSNVDAAIAYIKANPKFQGELRLRQEQLDSIEEAEKRFNKKDLKDRKFLWNAKMRFGKTLSALQLVKNLNLKSTLIVTHRPVVGGSWEEDFGKIFTSAEDKAKWSFGSRSEKDAESKNDFYTLSNPDANGNFVFFVSIQYLRIADILDGSEYDSLNTNERLKADIMNFPWDMVIIDEGHEGIISEKGGKVTDRLKKEETRTLWLSGTPYNLLDGFSDDESFTWDYVAEQERKLAWDELHYGDPNPYEDLPHMNLFTLKMPSVASSGMSSNDEDRESIGFTEFFRVFSGDKKKDGIQCKPEQIGKFVHEKEVNQFLTDLFESDGKSNYPFARDEFIDNFKHTFWILPGVEQAKALEDLLYEHDYFGGDNYKVINVAGEGNTEAQGKKLMDEVRKYIEGYNPATGKIDGKFKKECTITLSCGKLTTGVSVRPWTAVLYLKGSDLTTASAYMQTIFRVQTPAVLDGRQKRECYVFDFSPNRALRVVSEIAQYSDSEKTTKAKKDKMSTDEEERIALERFLKVMNIKGFAGGKMEEYDVNKVFRQMKNVYIERAVLSGYDDTSIYDHKQLEREWTKAEIDAVIGLESMKKRKDTAKVILGGDSENGNDDDSNAKNDDESGNNDTGKDKNNKDKSEEDKKKAAKAAKIALLRSISIRVPLLVYGADIDHGGPITLDNFTERIDDASWNEFMPKEATKEVFRTLQKMYNREVFDGAAERIQSQVRQADNFSIEERIEHIAKIFRCFRNPDKETVLTPWRVVNMHLSDTIGGFTFYDEDFHERKKDEEAPEPRLIVRDEVTEEIFGSPYARILEINSKTGLYPLYMAYSMYRRRIEQFKAEKVVNKDLRYDQIEAKDKWAIWEDTLQDNIFVVCRTPMAELITRRTLAGFRKDINMNVRTFRVALKEEDLSELTVQNGKKELTGVTLDRLAHWGGLSKDSIKYKQLSQDLAPTENEDGSKTPKILDLIDLLQIEDKIRKKKIKSLTEDDKQYLFAAAVRRGNDFWHVYNNIPSDMANNEVINNLKFSAVVGNPPYDVIDGGGGSSSKPIYDKFVTLSQGLCSSYISLIMPSRWMTGGKGLDAFRAEMLKNRSISVLHDYFDSKLIFPNVLIEGGICYFRMDVGKDVKCFHTSHRSNGISKAERYLNDNDLGVVVRDANASSILAKVINCKTKLFSDFVYPRNPFNLTNKDIRFSESPIPNGLTVFGRFDNDRGYRYISKEASGIKNSEIVNTWTVFLSKADGAAGQLGHPIPARIIGKGVVGAPDTVCTETFLAIGPFKLKEQADNVVKYCSTKFFRFMVGIRKLKNMTRSTFEFVPFQDFSSNSSIPWSESIKQIDEHFFDLYHLDDDERDYINKMITTLEE